MGICCCLLDPQCADRVCIAGYSPGTQEFASQSLDECLGELSLNKAEAPPPSDQLVSDIAQ